MKQSKKLFILLLFLFVIGSTWNVLHAQVTELWTARYNGPANSHEQANSITVDQNGNVYVTGYSYAYAASVQAARDFATIKYNVDGVQQWVATYNGPGDDYDEAKKIAVDSNGNVYVAGLSVGAGTLKDYALIKYNSNGVEQWVARYNGSFNGDDEPADLTVDSNGNVYVTGYGKRIGGGSTGYAIEFVTIKYNSDGVVLWTAKHNTANDWPISYAKAIAVDALGNVYVTGQAWDEPSYNHDYTTIKYNSNGLMQWLQRYNGPGNSTDTPYDMAVDNNGNVYVTGRCTGISNYDYATVKYNSVGVQQWVSTYNGPGNGTDEAYSIAVDQLGYVSVTGRSKGSGDLIGYATIRYNSNGVEEWVNRYNGPLNNNAEGQSLALDNAGNVYVTGYCATPYWNYATIKYYTSGNQQWVQLYDGPGSGHDFARDIIVDSDDNVYVTGGSAGVSSSTDYATIKYGIPTQQPPTDISLSNNSVVENSPVGTIIGILSATDINPGETFIFSEMDDPDGKFSVVGDELRVDGILDFETATNHQITIRVTDNAGLTFDKLFTIAVTDINDVVTNLLNSGNGSLRAAIDYANTHPGPDIITFTVAGTINITSQLPDVSDASGGTTIDGTSAPGYAGIPIVVLNGPGTGYVPGSGYVKGIIITSANNEVNGLQIGNFQYGIEINGSSASGNKITGNYIGNKGNVTLANSTGIQIIYAQNNYIGTDGNGTNDIAERNVISGNNGNGINFSGTSTGNIVAGNFIGTDATGTVALANSSSGIRINSGCHNNLIGTNGDGSGDEAERNIISGNSSYGIQNYYANNTVIAGNYIGVDVSGSYAIGNGSSGITCDEGSHYIRIGTDGNGIADESERNVISGNPSNGVIVYGDGCIIAGNYIGTDALGLVAIGNTSIGISTSVGAGTRIGTDGNGMADLAERNVISGNGNSGLSVGGTGTIVAGNYIGTDVTGTVALGNGGRGVQTSGSPANIRIGTNGDGISDIDERNIISGNTGEGVYAGGSNIVVAGNYIGTDVSGTIAFGNRTGVSIFGAVRVGTNGDGVSDDLERNIISGNSGDLAYGVYIGGNGGIVRGNYIGTDVTGSAPLGNLLAGIRINFKSNANIHSNVIAFNGEEGIYVLGTNSIQNLISQNSIFSNGNLGIDLSSYHPPDGITSNDEGDGDTGSNKLQNFPFLNSVTTGAGNTTVGGTLNSTPNTTFTLEFFSNSVADPSGYGEGENFLGSTNVTTDGSGNTNFSVILPTEVTEGEFITATATDPNGNTSEFSAAVEATLPNTPPVANDDYYEMYGNILVVNAPGVLTNDTDAESNPLSAYVIDLPSKGNVVLNTDGSFTYTISANFDGTDNFTYKANDGTNESNIATVIIKHMLYVTNLNDDGVGSLRWTITNANTHTGSDIIKFAVSGTINISSQLPSLSDASGGTTIDGTTAPGYSGIPLVAISGSGSGYGIHIPSANNQVKALQIFSFGNGIYLDGASASENMISGNYIGTDGTIALPNSNGVNINLGSNNIIGTNGDGVDDAIEGNIISGNNSYGVKFYQSTNNIVAGNYIGTNATGTGAIPNLNGIEVKRGGNIRIGTDGNNISDETERNLISGNTTYGVTVVWTTDILISGNYIGTDITGTYAIANENGISVNGMMDDLSDVLIGTNSDGIADVNERNLISGNRGVGIGILNVSGPVVAGNYVGTDVTGMNALGNGGSGINVGGGNVDSILIGTNGDGFNDEIERNIVSGNGYSGLGSPGISLGGQRAIIAGNFIGTNASGTAALGNNTSGIHSVSGRNSRISKNLISSNIGPGILMYGSTGNKISGNFIGTDVIGNDPLGNGGNGIQLSNYDNSNNNIDGNNIIAFNNGDGISFLNVGLNNSIRKNSIHSNSELGIDLLFNLSYNGVTPNDPGDTDGGPNGQQNFPVITEISFDGINTTINGIINSTANTTFAIDFYSNSNSDPSGYGEGENFLGSTNVTTDGSGNTSFSAVYPVVVTEGEFITSTATDPNGNTSEFSAALEYISNQPPTDITLSPSSVAENEPIGTVVGTFSTTDPQGGTFIYSLVPGAGDTDNGSFTIVGDQLQTNAVFDYETQNTFTIRVKSIDDGGLFIEKTLTVTATDVNETPTDIALSNYSVEENTPVGIVIGTLSAIDPDAGETFTFGEVLDPDSKFAVVGEELRVDGALDFETKTSHEVTIRVTDSGSLTFDKLFTITVIDINEAPTDIELSNSNVAENEPVATVVGTFNTIDPDGGTFTYSLVAGAGDTDNGSFTIDGDQLKTNAVFDYETQNTFSIRVHSENGGGLFVEEIFAITATDVNETPTDIALSNSSIDENTPVGTVIGTLTALDPDAGETFTFGEVLDPDSKFSVVGNELKVDGPLDFETAASHEVTIRVTDSGSLTFDKLFTITVIDVNEAPTDIELSNSSVAENEPVATVVGTFNTIDPDGGTFTYSLVPGAGDTDNGSFIIDGDQLKTNAVFDYETQNTFSIRVHSENGGGLFVEEIFAITATDVNETPTDIALSNSSIDENTPVGTVIGTLTALDPDAGETFTFGEVLDPDSKFAVVGSELRVDGSLDFETAASHNVTIRVTDSGSLTFDKLFTITVNDVNEAPTDIELSNSSVAENEPVATVVGTFSTIDPEGGTFTYSLVPGAGDTDNGSFTIDGDQLKTNALFDYETQNIFSILVHSENGGGLFVEEIFNITATNVNEIPTDIALSNSSIDENTPVGTVIGTLTALDPDAGETFTFGEVLDPDSKFSVVGNELRVDGVLDFETATSHEVTIRVTDSGSLTIDKLFTITVIDINEAPTDIELSNSNVAENEPVATVVGTFNTIDPEGGTFTYSLVPGAGDTDNGSFTIDGDQLKTNAVFDYETQNTFSVRVKSVNGGSLFIEEVFTITITDANEAPIANAGSDQNICSSGPPDVTLDGSGSSDPNSDSLTYSWHEGAVVIATGINPTVTFSLGAHNIILIVDDGNGGTDSDEVIITVNALPNVTFNALGPFYISDPPVDLSSFVTPEGGTFSGPGISGNEFNPEVAGAGTHTLTYSFTNVNGCSNSAQQEVLVISTGTITGIVSENGIGLEGVTVKLLDLAEMTTEFDDQYTDEDGQYSFMDIPAVEYKVMIVEPLGYSADMNPKLASVISNETTTIDFYLSQMILTNRARSKGYMKHQFDVYVRGRGNAQETESDLQSYIEAVHEHYDPHFDLFADLNTFEDWQGVLSVSNNSTKLEKAKQHLAALVLNLSSLKIGQYEIVTEDNRTCGDALTYASILIENPEATEDDLELGKDIAENINNHKLINAGIVPQSSVLYKGSSGANISWTFDVPEEYTLYNNFPNPFNPTTTIRYGLREDTDVTLKVYSLLGDEVATLVNEHQAGGTYQVEFFAGNLASGIYIYRISTEKFTATKKLMLIK